MICRMSLRWRSSNAARQPQPFARVRVVRADAHAAELGERNLFGRVVEQHDLQRVARILRLDQLRQRQRDALGRREAILAVQNHAVAAVEHQHRGARALILALHDHQIFVGDVDPARGVGLPAAAGGRRPEPDALALLLGARFALRGVQQRAAGVEVQRVAELVRLRRAGRFDAGRLLARVVAAVAALAERAEQIAQRAVAEKIERLVGDLELDRRLVVAAGRCRPRPCRSARAARGPAASRCSPRRPCAR